MEKSLREYVEEQEKRHEKRYAMNDFERWPNMRKECYAKGDYMTLYTDIYAGSNRHGEWHKLYYIIFDHFDFERNEIVGNEVETRNNKSFDQCDFKEDVWAGQEVMINFRCVTKFYECLFLGPDM